MVDEQLGQSLAAGDVADLRRLLRQILERSGAWDDARCDPAAAREPELREAG